MSRIPRTVVALACVFTVLAPAVADSQPAAPALTGSFDQITFLLTLNAASSGEIPPGSTYTWYENNQAVHASSNASVAFDLSGWTEGVREFRVTVTVPDSNSTSPLSAPFRVVKDVELPSNCPVASISIYTRPPGAEYKVYTECLPG